MGGTLIVSKCSGNAGSCVIDFGEYSELPESTYINQANLASGSYGMGACQCTAYAADRIYQIIQQNIRDVCPGKSWNGYEWSGNLADCGYPVYYSVNDAISNFGTLAGLLMCVGPNSCFGGSCNHIAICEGYDSSLDQVYVSEMYGGYMDCMVRLNVYSTGELSQVRWIDISSIGFSANGGGRKRYFKDTFGEFHWKNTPAKDVLIPDKNEYQTFCDRLNQAQDEAKVENKITFSASQDNGILTAKRFNQYLYLMQESNDGKLLGVNEEECPWMDDVKKDDVIYAKHFLQLENLYNAWCYGSPQSGTDVPMEGSYAERVYDYLRSIGYTAMGACGILGNMAVECGGYTLSLDPFVTNSLGCYGIVQWCPPPYSGHFSQGGMYVGMSFEDQLRYLGTNSYGSIQNIVSGGTVNGGGSSITCGTSAFNSLKNATSIYEATRIFFHCYEGAGDSTLGKRQELAYEAYNLFKNRPLWTPDQGGTASGKFILPLQGWYGKANCRPGDTNNAGDYPAPYGIPVIAADGGTVEQSQIWDGYTQCFPSNSLQTYGNSVLINHGNGWKTRYAHFSGAPLVSYGQAVSQGQLLGYVGSTGCSSGAHLHFEMIYNGIGYCPNGYI